MNNYDQKLKKFLKDNDSQLNIPSGEYNKILKKIEIKDEVTFFNFKNLKNLFASVGVVATAAVLVLFIWFNTNETAPVGTLVTEQELEEFLEDSYQYLILEDESYYDLAVMLPEF